MRALLRPCLTACLATCLWHAGAALAIDVWHYGTLPLGPLRCEATFMFDAGRSTFRELRVQALAKDRQGQVQARFTLTPADMGVDRNNRFASATWVASQACDPELVVVFRSAIAVVDGLPVDLLATQQLRVRRFEPIELRLPQSRERP